MKSDWPFDDSPNSVVITTRQVVEQGLPILLVTHDADDGAWQALCGTTNEPDDARVVGLGEVYKIDQSIGQLADLPLGWRAWRQSIDQPWKREKTE